MNKLPALLPCPFCGVIPKDVMYLGNARVVLCNEENCPTNISGTLEEAINAWNTRK